MVVQVDKFNLIDIIILRYNHIVFYLNFDRIINYICNNVDVCLKKIILLEIFKHKIL